jgi:hypothetical protein
LYGWHAHLLLGEYEITVNGSRCLDFQSGSDAEYQFGCP